MLNIKKLRQIYFFALSLIAVLMLMAFFVMANAISTQSYDSTIMKTATKQAMLSQRVALLTTQLLFQEKREWAMFELTKAVNELKSAHIGLTVGDETLNLPGIRTEESRHLYYDKRIQYPGSEFEGLVSLDEFMLHYIEEIEEVLSLNDSEMTLNDLLLRHTINDYHDMVLPLLLEIVDQYEQESQHNVNKLLNLEKAILFTALLVLILEALFIFWPMILKIEEYAARLIEENANLERKRHQEKLAALGQLSGGIAHEINNALQPILGLSSIIKLRTKDKDPELYKYTTTIENSALNARKIIKGILSFSRQSSENLELSRAQDVIDHACNFAQSFVPSSIELTKHSTLSDDTFLECDETSITQVFVNILKNASEAMSDKGIIKIKSQCQMIEDENIPFGQYVCIEISDSGCGMNADVQSNIFNPFYTTKDEGKGTGLGLSTAFAIIRRHSGHITVKSKPDQGSTFTIYLPKKHSLSNENNMNTN